MSIEEINEYLTNTYKAELKKRKKYKSGSKSKKDIRKAQAATFTLITEQPYKNEAIAFLVQNRPQLIASLFPNYITISTIKELEKDSPEIYYYLPAEAYSNHPELVSMISDNESVIFDLLPEELRKDENIQHIFKQRKKIYNSDAKDKYGFDTDWVDEKGNLREFFKLKNDFPITSKADYLQLVQQYLKSDLSIPAFCAKYEISSVSGFQNLLNRVAAENTDLEKAISDIKLRAQQEFLGGLKNVVSDFNNGDLTFEDYLKSRYNQFHKFSYIFNNVNNREELMNQVVQYFKDNKQQMMLSKISTLFGEESKELVKEIGHYLDKVGIRDSETMHTLYNTVELYDTPFRRDYIKGKVTKIGGETHDIDDNIIDQALVYLKDNEIDRCYYTVYNTSVKIAFGELDYSQETQEYREELESNALRLADNLTKVRDRGIDGYIDVMEEEAKLKGYESSEKTL